MKKIYTLLTLSFLFAQNSCTAEGFASKQEQQEAYRERFGRYINPNLSEFEKNSYAFLFRRIQYSFHRGLNLGSFHKDPSDYIMEQWRQTLDEYKKCNESTRASAAPYYSFRRTTLDLSRQFALGYSALSPEEQKKSASYHYSSPNTLDSHPEFEIFEDVEKTSNKFSKRGIQKKTTEVLADATTMIQNFRNEQCKEYDALNKYTPDRHSLKTHACLYADLLHKYITAVHTFEVKIEQESQ